MVALICRTQSRTMYQLVLASPGGGVAEANRFRLRQRMYSKVNSISQTIALLVNRRRRYHGLWKCPAVGLRQSAPLAGRVPAGQ